MQLKIKCCTCDFTLILLTSSVYPTAHPSSTLCEVYHVSLDTTRSTLQQSLQLTSTVPLKSTVSALYNIHQTSVALNPQVKFSFHYRCPRFLTLAEFIKSIWSVIVIGLLTGNLGLNGHLYKIGNYINPICRRCLNETVEHLQCECESLTMSRGRIFGPSFRELQQLSHVTVDLFRRFST